MTLNNKYVIIIKYLRTFKGEKMEKVEVKKENFFGQKDLHKNLKLAMGKIIEKIGKKTGRKNLKIRNYFAFINLDPIIPCFGIYEYKKIFRIPYKRELIFFVEKDVKHSINCVLFDNSIENIVIEEMSLFAEKINTQIKLDVCREIK